MADVSENSSGHIGAPQRDTNITQTAHAQYKSLICRIILRNPQMAENIKDLYDLYENPGKRFKAINNSMEFSMKKTLFLINLVCSCFLCGYFPDPLRFKPRILGGKGNRLQKLRKYLLHFRRHILKSILQSN